MAGKFIAVLRSLQKRLLSQAKRSKNPHLYECEEADVSKGVKEGHFSVVAAIGEEPTKFMVPLNYLSHPTFVRLLEQAAEEYGFCHEGALEIPCWPFEIESLLAEQWRCCC
ncbi:PREDICTED: auxin-induced protein 10A5-like [Tarenaya hassleriana]|uniref:auxin-induced protein 10A5-like n=1 Tax=Tarenaya hassleriana TaxID=28532 RepID=UPI00053C9436|nr:PREDICTED: auxin-induced protein 10A5-like [Tarenaya hassleriana]